MIVIKIIIAIGIVIIASCGQKNPSSSSVREIQSQEIDYSNTDSKKIRKERYPDPRDSVLRNYVDNRKLHPDSIKKRNAQVIAEKEKYKIKADSDTKSFTINPKTGEVNGCPLIQFKSVLNDDYWQTQKRKRDSLRNEFASIKPTLRSIIMKDKQNELWYGDPKNVEIKGTPEATQSGRGPVGFLYTDDGKNLVVPVGYPHGGMMDEIFFFDTRGKLLTKHKLDRLLNMPFIEFNAEQTFVTLSDGVSGDFYFFTDRGKLERKGNFNKLTGEGGTSYGKAEINSSGSMWLLQNNLGYLFYKDSLKSKINGHNFFIDERNGVLWFFEKRNHLSIFNLRNLKLKYQSNQDNIRLLQINNRILYIQSLINEKIFTYEIK